jgi:RecA/RadA recombinase
MAEITAIPVLASAELDYQLRKNATRIRIKSGCSTIDDALKGGLDSGRITCISGDKALGKTTVGLRISFR